MAKRRREPSGSGGFDDTQIAMADLGSIANEAKTPVAGEAVPKDECVYTFDSPASEHGLYVSLKSFRGVGHDYLHHFHAKTKERLFLNFIKRPVPKEAAPAAEEGDAPPKKKPTKLAIGVDGGFDVAEEKVVYNETYKLVILPELQTIDFNDVEAKSFQDLPLAIQNSVRGILAAETASRQQDVAAWMADPRVISKHAAGLLQLDNGVQVPPKGWKCARCDLTNNLWMNLTDGTILCGRRYFDGTGGNNHALEHFGEKKFPLAVKLGTITTEGGDVYSYDEDDMVLDPNLAVHLRHFGINIASLEKTDKTMAELEVDLNMKFEWDVITEADSKLQPLFGAGYTGLENLGNTCYMNSTMQVLFSIPAFRERYYPSRSIVETCVDPTTDFECQMSKLADGLLSGRYSQSRIDDIVGPDGVAVDKLTDEEKQKLIERGQKGIPPRSFKSVVGKGHSEFSSTRQQDAQEFLLHILNMVDRDSRKHQNKPNPANCFKFQTEERLCCLQSNKVRYCTRDDMILPLPVPIEASTNKEEVAAFEALKVATEAKGQKVDTKDVVLPRVSLDACLSAWKAAEQISDFMSPATGSKGVAEKTSSFKSFPEFLIVQAKRFYLDDKWVPKKLDVLIDVPDTLDLNSLRSTGLRPGEEELPAGGPAAAPAAAEPAFEFDDMLVMQLVSMGFDVEGCKRAFYHTKNSGVEAAMNWVLEHMGDADFTTPFQLPTSSSQAPAAAPGANEPNEEDIGAVMAMGFERFQAVKALTATNNSVERAIDWIFNHPEELSEMAAQIAAGGTAADPALPSDQPMEVTEADGCYRLVALISHMGSSTLCGHYVCHIFKEGRWVIYNDSKVAVSEKPPRDRAYLYIYQRA